ncbi:hypothetical protein JJB09_08630 [Rhizobium sp. KVB221]|uniref:DUF1269 domain-containing protein n=1 Tax=Rhizobium setariae TaxID=2801340 RepID=A0A936YNS4_9HYPH|nr:hypothetical protein [Rhizobium setariae]MBL0372092.1 hypothetical protein [Rhizobium setariae]
MKILTGLFDTYAQAGEAVTALKASGIAEDDMSLISRDPDHVSVDSEEHVGVGSGIGLVAGGAGGLLAGLGMITIPGIGPVVAVGWLTSTLAGAAAGMLVGGATGSLIDALTSSDIGEDDAHVLAESVRRGGTLVTVCVHDDRVIEAQGIIDRFGSVDLGERRRVFREEGWDEFDGDLPPYAHTETAAPEEYLEEQRRQHSIS